MKKLSGSGFSIFLKNFFEKLFQKIWFFSKTAVDFQKSVGYGKSALYPLCLHNSVGFFLHCYTFYSLRKSVWVEFLSHIFGFFTFAQKTTLSNLRFWVQKIPCVSGYAHFFTQKVMSLRKVKFSIFLTVFQIFVFFPRKLPSRI